ncbi:MAG: hypothetical protein ACXVEF_36015 [Polyangiales bacterium]
MRSLGIVLVATLTACSSGGSADPPATSSYDCSGAVTRDLPTRDAAESICASVRRSGRECQVCVQTVDPSGKELAFSANETPAPCGCEQPKVLSACKACSETGLTGVRVCISADTCSFNSGTGGTFTYEVTVDDTAPILHTAATGPGCSVCASWSADPLSFVSWNIGGGSIRYCMCDTGCCAPQTEKTITLDRGKKSGTIDWPGKQWNGPSDTGAPLGDPFPPGTYSVSVSFQGAKEGTVTATLPITVGP